MPPKGGKTDLTVQGFSDALSYMINQSVGNWKRPDKKMMDAIQADIAARQKLSATQ
jgi:hypothetical protein